MSIEKAREILRHQFVSLDKVETIRAAILKFAESNALSPIKEFFGDNYTYGEIRAVMASM